MRDEATGGGHSRHFYSLELGQHGVESGDDRRELIDISLGGVHWFARVSHDKEKFLDLEEFLYVLRIHKIVIKGCELGLNLNGLFNLIGRLLG